MRHRASAVTHRRVAAGLTVAVPWRAGDVLVVDNTPFLHGRQAFTDHGRAVMVRMGSCVRS